MRELIKPELDIPKGYRLKEARPRCPKRRELYLCLTENAVEEATFDFVTSMVFILEKIPPVWQWPRQLKGNFAAADESGVWWVYETRPGKDEPHVCWYKIEGNSWCAEAFDLDWPPYDSWENSLIAKADCEVV